MRTLIVKLNATGDVVRTTALLRRLEGDVIWITAANNAVLLEGVAKNLTCIGWERRAAALDDQFDLVISLEDEAEVAAFVKSVRCHRVFGALLNGRGELSYSDDSKGWFDMSLISNYGRVRADVIKLENRRTYQDLIFEGLGFRFCGEPYVLPRVLPSDLCGDVAIAPVAGAVWPMKNWAYYDVLKERLEACGLKVNVLPQRPTLVEHLADVAGHRCLVGGDSLPMHLALGSGTQCVTLFNCTSPWEIHDYGLLTKIVSPLLAEFYYRRGMDERAVKAISVEEVFEAVMKRLGVGRPEHAKSTWNCDRNR
jgi:heptosyltransferase II